MGALMQLNQCESTTSMTEYIRLDVFFCEKCCEFKEVEKREYSRGRPLWWTH